jgi:adenylate cyclase
MWLALSVFAAALLGALLGRSTLRWWVAGPLVVLGVAALAGGAFFAFKHLGFMMKLIGPVTAFGLCFFIQSRLAQSQLQDERKLYSTALERYLAPQVISRIEQGEPMTISAERREITVMVSDIESFSSLVAEASMEDLAAIMNGYFVGLYDVLWKHEAMLDKLTGDGVIVLFGAPFKYADHADRAIACARDITAFSEAYRKEVQAKYNHKLGRTRMGLHTGECLVGNFGGEKRFNYTAYGQVVVIAARLEAANKEFDTVVLFSEDTRRMTKRPVASRLVSEVKLKGVPHPVPAHTVD